MDCSARDEIWALNISTAPSSLANAMLGCFLGVAIGRLAVAEIDDQRRIARRMGKEKIRQKSGGALEALGHGRFAAAGRLEPHGRLDDLLDLSAASSSTRLTRCSTRNGVRANSPIGTNSRLTSASPGRG